MRRALAGPIFALLAALPLPAASDWLVYVGGGIEEVRGPWKVKGGQVVFTAPSGALQAARLDDVDLAASAFLTWQVGERRGVSAAHPPAGTEMRSRGAAAPGKASEAPCTPARVVSVIEAETIEIAVGAKQETVHLACVDAPGTRHRFPALSALGGDARERVELLARPGFTVCVAEEVPALVDRQGHRVVYVQLPDGRDLGGELLGRGLALARSGGCARESAYVAAEAKAIAGHVGHWDGGRDDLASVVAQETTGAGGGLMRLPPPAASSGRS